LILAKNWQYMTVFSIRLGHVERVAGRIDPKLVMHLKPFCLSLSFGPPSSLSSTLTQQAFQRLGKKLEIDESIGCPTFGLLRRRVRARARTARRVKEAGGRYGSLRLRTLITS